MEIHEIKLINDGYKGLFVYMTEERKMPNGRKYLDKDWKEKNDMVHSALDRPIKDLRKHLLEICGCLGDEGNQAEIDYNIAETRITGIKMMKTFFILEGEKEWLNDKTFKLKTPKIEEKDGYHNFGVVVELIREIKKETEIYMKGAAKISDEECAIRYLSSGKNKTDLTPDSFNKMSTEEKAQWCKEWLENEVGGMVTLQEDLAPDTEEEQQEEQIVDLSKQTF